MQLRNYSSSTIFLAKLARNYDRGEARAEMREFK